MSGIIWSARKDFAVLFLPVVLFYFLLLTPLREALLQQQGWLAVILAFFFLDLVDSSHALSSYFRIFGNSHFRNRIGRYLLLHAGILFFSVSLYFFSELVFWTFYSLFNWYHLARQQVGFVRISARNYGRTSLKILNLQSALIQAAGLLPFVIWFADPANRAAHLSKGYQLFLPDWIYPGALLFYAGTIVVFVVTEYFASGLRNRTKQYVFLSTVLVFGSLIWLGSPLFFGFLAVLSHSIAYLTLVNDQCRKAGERGHMERFDSIFKGGAPTVRFALVLGVTSILGIVGWNWAGQADHMVSKLFQFASLDNMFFKALLIGTLATPTLAHFLLDRYIWNYSTLER